ncbi:MAG: hypothetical protein ACJ79S_10200 [Gemmatimonadaceae bacterium]
MHEQLAGGGLFFQVVSVVGALLVLAGYAGLQSGALKRESRLFNAINFVGSALLAWVAVLDRRWGFILLEGTWALLSVPGMVRRRSR